MPELPEVETVRQGLDAKLTGLVLERVEALSPKLRYPLLPVVARLESDQTLIRIGRRAKYLLFEFSKGQVLISHLGMSGSFRFEAPYSADKRRKHDHLVMTFSGDLALIYHDPRRFGFVDLVGVDELTSSRHLSTLGIEPLSNALNGPGLLASFAASRRNLKALLLDQKIIAGLGNIYVSEALYRARLLPSRKGHEIRREEAEALAPSIKAVLNAALASGGSTLRNYSQSDGKMGYFQHQFDVYDREGQPCRRKDCSGMIQKAIMQGRSSFFCPLCQI